MSCALLEDPRLDNWELTSHMDHKSGGWVAEGRKHSGIGFVSAKDQNHDTAVQKAAEEIIKKEARNG